MIEFRIEVAPVDETCVLTIIRQKEQGQSGNYSDTETITFRDSATKITRVFYVEPRKFTEGDRFVLTFVPGETIAHDEEQNAVVIEK